MPATRQAAGGRKGRGAGYCLDMTKSSFPFIDFIFKPCSCYKSFFLGFLKVGNRQTKKKIIEKMLLTLDFNMLTLIEI